MRLLFLTALLGGLCSAVQAAPPGYQPPRRFYTASHQAYRRLPTKLSLGINTAYYNGDLTNRLSDNTLRVGLSLGLVRTLSPRISFGVDLGYVKLKAQDYFPSRGYSFENTNGMLTTFLRYNLIADKSMYFGQNYRRTPVLVFVQAGIGGLIYNPDLYQNLGGPYPVSVPSETPAPYPGLAGVLPVGGGVTLRASQSLSFTFEGLYYFTSTDLLDGLSQRGNPDSLDGFATGALKIEYAFGHKKGKPLVHFD
jgi:hypothetical protein